MTDLPTETLADRVWLAIHCLPRRPNGRAPSLRSLQDQHGVHASSLSKLFSEQQRSLDPDQLNALAKAAGTTSDWLLYGRGAPPRVTGPVRPRELDYPAAAVRSRDGSSTRVEIDAPRTEPLGALAEMPAAPPRTTEPGRWRALAGADREFGRLATKVTTRAPIDGHPVALVEAALDLASDDLPRHRGAGFDALDVRFAYESAWAFLNDLPAPVRKIPEPTEAPAAKGPPQRASLEAAEDTFQAALRGAQPSPAPPAKNHPRHGTKLAGKKSGRR